MDPKSSSKEDNEDSDTSSSTETDISHPILRNAARCAHCGDMVESRRTHDMIFCSCESIWVDGGKDYLRYGFDKAENFIPMFEVEGRPNINKKIEKVIKSKKDN